MPPRLHQGLGRTAEAYSDYARLQCTSRADGYPPPNSAFNPPPLPPPLQAYQRQLDLARIEALEYERELMRRRMKILVHENQGLPRGYPPNQGGSLSSPLVSPRPSGSSDGLGDSGTNYYAPFDADQSPINTDLGDLQTAHNLRVVVSASERDDALHVWQTRSDELRSRENDGGVGETDTALDGGDAYRGRRHLSVHTARQHLPGVRDPSEPPPSEQRMVGNPAANASGSHSERAEWLLRAQSSGSRRRAQQQLLHVPRRRAEEAQVHAEAARRASIASHESRIEELQKKVPVGLSLPSSSTHAPNETSPLHTVPPREVPRVSPTPLSPHSLPTSTSTRTVTDAPPPARPQTGQHVPQRERRGGIAAPRRPPR